MRSDVIMRTPKHVYPTTVQISRPTLVYMRHKICPMSYQFQIFDLKTVLSFASVVIFFSRSWIWILCQSASTNKFFKFWLLFKVLYTGSNGRYRFISSKTYRYSCIVIPLIRNIGSPLPDVATGRLRCKTSTASRKQSKLLMLAMSSSIRDSEYQEAQFVFLLLMCDCGSFKRVLMIEENGEPYLPYFEYPFRSSEHKVDACLKLQSKLSIDSTRQHFIAVFDPLGYLTTSTIDGAKTNGYSNLVLLEPRDLNFGLPSFATWQDVEHSEQIAATGNRNRGPDCTVHEELFSIVKDFQTGRADISYLNDIRYTPGWFSEASEYLISVLEDNGVHPIKPVFQHSVSSTSTLLKVETNYGQYYLKCPGAGCDEVSITKIIVQLLPSYTASIVGTNSVLNCFVSEPFETEDECHSADVLQNIVAQISHVHRDSLHCVAELERGGVPDRSPQAIIEQVNKWLNGNPNVKEFTIIYGHMLAENLELITNSLQEVSESGVPSTLVHGDLCESNYAHRRSGKRDSTNDLVPILYDWQHACISHPFFDFHRIQSELSPQLVENILNQWIHVSSIERLRRTFKLSCILGWMLKFWNGIDCLAACDPERCSVLVEFCIDCLEEVIYGLRNLSKT